MNIGVFFWLHEGCTVFFVGCFVFGSVVAAVWSVTRVLLSASLITFLQVDCVSLDSLIGLGCHFKHKALGDECLTIIVNPDRFPLDFACLEKFHEMLSRLGNMENEPHLRRC